MRVPLACVADAATISSDGKLYIMGEFNCIHSSSLPVVWEEMDYVARLEFDAGDERDLQIRLAILDPDMKVIAPPLEMTAKLGEVEAGVAANPPLVMRIQHAVFQEFGQHVIQLRVNGKVLASTYIHIVRRPPPAAPA